MPNYDVDDITFEEPSKKALLATLAQLQQRHYDLLSKGRAAGAAIVKRSITNIERKLSSQNASNDDYKKDKESDDENGDSGKSAENKKETSEALDLMGHLSRRSLSKSILLGKKNGKLR